MAKRKKYPYPQYVQYLTSKGKSATTANTYSSQVRRIIKECGVDEHDVKNIQKITDQQIEGWLAQQPQRNRTPYRAAWRAFADFFEEALDTDIAPCDIGRDIEIPTALKAVIKLLALEIPLVHLSKMKWNFVEGRLKDTFPHDFLLSYEGKIAFIPKEYGLIIKKWAYPSSKNIDGKPFIPVEPNASFGMNMKMLRRCVEEQL